jgi:phosphoglycerol transferase MdoB-like AlkP superfamily enzyme
MQLESNTKKNLFSTWYSYFSWAGPYTLLLQFSVAALFLMSISRILLVWWQYQRVSSGGIFPAIFFHGMRADVIQVGLFLLVPVLLAPLFMHNKMWSLWKKMTFFWTLLAFIIITLLEVSTPTFITQFDSRPNRLFIEYLMFPKEVFGMLWNGFRLVLLGGILAIILLAWLYRSMSQPWLNSQPRWNWKLTLLTWPLILLLVVACIRSTTQHRPANPAMFSLTSDAMVNSLTINSTWSVVHAIYGLKHEDKSGDEYGALSKKDILTILRASPWLADKKFNNENFPTVHFQQSTAPREKPLNIVILLQESLGATFVESLGGVAVTPNLERLKTEGWWFERLFATGTRSVRGIEAVVSGFPPTPARSVVKLSLSQNRFYTIADQLARLGYQTEFVYGGEAHFDNMRSFFSGNGFNNIVDAPSFEKPEFVGSWGVSDEDLFNKADQRLQTMHAQGKPFFSLIFSSSNHAPFEFPEGKIALHEQPAATVNNAVKYADYALGKFIDIAKTRSYWKDTLFLIVADHDNRVYGDDLVPVNKFHIPGLILGGNISARTIKGITSQIDLAPTLLSLAGISGDTALFGRDISIVPDDFEGRAMMQFDNYYAWLEDKQVTVLRPGQPALKGNYDFVTRKIIYSEEAPSVEDNNKALANVLLPSILYRERSYYVPQEYVPQEQKRHPPHGRAP